MVGFCHLNLHTDRSLSVGLVKPRQLVDWAKKHSLQAAAITDNYNINAAIQLQKECKRAGIKPIFGMEVSVCDDKTKRVKGGKNLVLLAKNREGFEHLTVLATLGSMYFYYNPRIDQTDLEKYSGGLIALTACLQGQAASSYFSMGDEGLDQFHATYTNLFGDDLYYEVIPSLKEPQRIYNEGLKKWVQDTDRKLVVTGDVHYYAKEDAELHEHIMRTKVLANLNYDWAYPYDGPYHLRTRSEMIDQFGELHGYDISVVPEFKAAFDQPDEIVAKVESFNITDGIKIPAYKG